MDSPDIDSLRREKEEHDLREWKRKHDAKVHRQEERARVRASRHEPLGIILIIVGIIVIIVGFIPQTPSQAAVRSAFSGQEMIVDCESSTWKNHDACKPEAHPVGGFLIGGALVAYGFHRLRARATINNLFN